ncbi:MAG: hypothetical protein CMJ67_07250 [Planctomycetaceae bacterium]|nr:hypothetical protein [Planctomycetaceae bacterium]
MFRDIRPLVAIPYRGEWTCGSIFRPTVSNIDGILILKTPGDAWRSGQGRRVENHEKRIRTAVESRY